LLPRTLVAQSTHLDVSGGRGGAAGHILPRRAISTDTHWTTGVDLASSREERSIRRAPIRGTAAPPRIPRPEWGGCAALESAPAAIYGARSAP
jgi:hypothetical protein